MNALSSSVLTLETAENLILKRGERLFFLHFPLPLAEGYAIVCSQFSCIDSDG